MDELQKRVQKQNLSGKIYPLKCDVRNEEDILNVCKWIEKEFGRLDVLVNNAAVLVSERITEGKTENFRTIMDVNVIAVAIFIREAVKLMSKHKDQSHIININSVAGHNAEIIKYPISLYACSKYAITAMCESVRHELLAKNLNIKLTSISPGAVKTDMILSLSDMASVIDKIPMLMDTDVSNAVVCALSTAPSAEIKEITITPLHASIPDP